MLANKVVLFFNTRIFSVFLVGLMLITNALANDKLLYQISLNEPAGSWRDESATLVNADSSNPELVVKGEYHVKHVLPGKMSYMSNVEYIADKNGNRVKYSIEPHVAFDAGGYVGALFLKSAVG